MIKIGQSLLILGGLIWVAAATADEVQLKDGQLLRGTITAITPDSITISIGQPDGSSTNKVIPKDLYSYYSSKPPANAAWDDSTIVIGRDAAIGKSGGKFDYAKVLSLVNGSIYSLADGAGLVTLIGVDLETDLDPGSGGQTFSGRALQLVTKLLSMENNEIRLEFDTVRRDKNGKLLAYAYAGRAIGGKMINERLIELGYARYAPHETNLKYDKVLREAEERAKTAKAGLWLYDGLSDSKFYSALRADPAIGQIDPYTGMPYNPNVIPEVSPNMPLSEKVDLTPAMLAPSAMDPKPLKPAGPTTLSAPTASTIPVSDLAPPESPANPVADTNTNAASVPGVAVKTPDAPAGTGSAKPDETVQKVLEQQQQLIDMIRDKDKMLQQLMEEILKKNAAESKTEP